MKKPAGIKATLTTIGQTVYTDSQNRPYVWGKAVLSGSQEKPWVIIYDFFIGKGSKLMVYPMSNSKNGAYAISEVFNYSDSLIEAMELLVEKKVAEALAKKGM